VNTKGLNNYAKYSSIALQMGFIIFLGVFGGFKLDSWLHTKPIFTIILSLFSVVCAIYVVVKDLLKKKKEN
jgi:F0F1-type ATP synthase assembly protein I